MSINILERGGIYRVSKRFIDYHGQVFEPGRTFTYHSTSYWAYDDGIMLNCAETRIDFRAGESDELIENFSSYVEKIGMSVIPAALRRLTAPAAADWAWWEIAAAAAFIAWALFTVATIRPHWSWAYVAAWSIVLIAAGVLCGYLVAAGRRRKQASGRRETRGKTE